ncbi:uncharacterized protein LOC107179265 isoform X1 [Panthera tigris]|uniref:uncharacterized protein LOC107179265 isoform X1 n=1 Tax=Panthera tigris TaxID=9694 RepID=UPI001C6F664C|nr:uncharacterized protein LOC107179265 isoform X1 [Panthera tigris]XP_042852197.1 uncharacterized protein LOC107179265 isoform X1 [Panthera tigris]
MCFLRLSLIIIREARRPRACGRRGFPEDGDGSSPIQLQAADAGTRLPEHSVGTRGLHGQRPPSRPRVEDAQHRGRTPRGRKVGEALKVGAKLAQSEAQAATWSFCLRPLGSAGCSASPEMRLETAFWTVASKPPSGEWPRNRLPESGWNIRNHTAGADGGSCLGGDPQLRSSGPQTVLWRFHFMMMWAGGVILRPQPLPVPPQPQQHLTGSCRVSTGQRQRPKPLLFPRTPAHSAVFSHVALPCSAKVASTCAGPGAVSPSEEEENPARF